MIDSNLMNAAGEADRFSFEAAYERLLREYQALDASELTIVNVDITAAVTRVFGVLPKVRALRPRIALLPELDIDLIDKLELYALGVSHAHALHLANSRPKDSLRALAKEGTRLRGVLLGDAMSLARRGRFDPERLTRLKGP